MEIVAGLAVAEVAWIAALGFMVWYMACRVGPRIARRLVNESIQRFDAAVEDCTCCGSALSPWWAECPECQTPNVGPA